MDADRPTIGDHPVPPTFELAGHTVPRLGYGAMRLTGQPGNFGPYADPAAGVALLRRAYDLGIRFVDTARAYGPGHNEDLIARAFAPWPDDLLVATKVGIEKPAPDDIRADGRPDAVRRGVTESLARLRRERLDLVYLHRPDPAVPIEDSVGALAELRDAGLVAHIGISNVTADQVARARAITPIAAVQNRYSPTDRQDDPLVDELGAAGIAYVPYGPLGAHPLRPGAPLADHPVLAGVAARYGATAGQIALAWLLHRAPHVLPVPGTTTVAHLEENVAAADIALLDDDLRDLGELGGA
jgi:aryl-alcohol dehydrogenase-like predicted oxidoreductase